jgi:hypothetical protein
MTATTRPSAHGSRARRGLKAVHGYAQTHLALDHYGGVPPRPALATEFTFQVSHGGLQ